MPILTRNLAGLRCLFALSLTCLDSLVCLIPFWILDCRFWIEGRLTGQAFGQFHPLHLQVKWVSPKREDSSHA